MMHYQGDNFLDIYLRLLEDIRTKGELEAKTRELVNVQFTLTRPEYGILPYKKNWQWAFQELLDRMSYTYGYKSLCNPGRAFIYRSNWKKKLVKEGGRFHYSYGEMFNDQINGVFRELKSKKSSREAIMTLWTPKYLLKQDKFLRRPCTLTFHFIVRKKRLHCFVNMRSNDIINLLPYDVFHHTFIQRWLAHRLKLGLGDYHHFCTHVYYPKRRELSGRKYFDNFHKKLSKECKAIDFDNYVPLSLGDSLDDDFKIIYDNYNNIENLPKKLKSPFLEGLVNHILDPSNCKYLI